MAKRTELELKKLMVLPTLKQKRQRLINATINNFQVSRAEDRENIQGTINYFPTLSGGGGFITWTMADNTEQDVTLEQLQGVLDAYVTRKAQVFQQFQEMKQSIIDATSIDEINRIVGPK